MFTPILVCYDFCFKLEVSQERRINNAQNAAFRHFIISFFVQRDAQNPNCYKHFFSFFYDLSVNVSPDTKYYLEGTKNVSIKYFWISLKIQEI